MVNKVYALMVMFVLAAFLGNFQGVCLAEPADADNTKINKQDTSPTEHTSDQQGQTEPADADNTKINKRDTSPTEHTADQQGQTGGDIEITQKIRQAVVDDESLSINAQNVKIITIDRVVTLKGPVKSEKEKMAIEEKAALIAGKENVRNELDIAE